MMYRAKNAAEGFPLLGVILINYCGLEDTCSCVQSIMTSSYKNIHIYIYDNASPDASGQKLFERYTGEARVKVFLMKENLGFGVANNLGIDRAFEDGCELVCILNNDTVVDSSMFAALASKAGRKTVTVPLMLYYDEPGMIWYGGGRFNRFGVPHHLHQGEWLANTNLVETEVSFATGCCLMISRAAFEVVGGFDSAYFLYWEDADLSLRMSAAGVQMVFVPNAVLYHKVSSSTGGEFSPASYYYGMRNKFYGIDKFKMGPAAKLWAYASLIRAAVSRKPQYQYALQAYRDYRAGRMGMFRPEP